MFPEFRPRDVIASQVARARYAEPVHRVGVHSRVPELVPAPGLVVASSAHVYPEVVHAHSIMGVAERATDAVLERLADRRASAGGRMSIDGTSTALRAPAAARTRSQRAMEIARAVAWPAGRALAFAVLVAVTWGTWGDLAHDTGYDFVAAQRIADGQLAYQDFPYIYGPLGLAVLGGRVQLPEHLDGHGDRRGARHGHGGHRTHLRPGPAAHGPARRGAGGHAGGHGRPGHGEHRPGDPALRLGLDGRGGLAGRAPGRRSLHAERQARAPRPGRRGRGGGAAHAARVRGRDRGGAGRLAGWAHPAGRGTGPPARRSRTPHCARASPSAWPGRPTA